jgi:hypothetical protein
MADNLPPSSADVTDSGSLNLPEPSGLRRPVMGLLYLFLILLMDEQMLCNFIQPPFYYPSFVGLNILCSTLRWNTFAQCSSTRVRGQVS